MSLTVLQLMPKCHRCNQKLKLHPFYVKAGAGTCSEHGDFFIQQSGENFSVVFRPFESSIGFAVSREKSFPPRIDDSPKKVFRAGHPGQTLKCVETGVIYASVKEASRMTGIHRSNIS